MSKMPWPFWVWLALFPFWALLLGESGAGMACLVLAWLEADKADTRAVIEREARRIADAQARHMERARREL